MLLSISHFFFFWLLFTHSATAPQLTADTYTTTTTTSFWQIAQPFLLARCIHLPAAALRTVPRHRQGITTTRQTLRHEGYDYTAYTGGQRHSLRDGTKVGKRHRSWGHEITVTSKHELKLKKTVPGKFKNISLCKVTAVHFSFHISKHICFRKRGRDTVVNVPHPPHAGLHCLCVCLFVNRCWPLTLVLFPLVIW